MQQRTASNKSRTSAWQSRTLNQERKTFYQQKKTIETHKADITAAAEADVAAALTDVPGPEAADTAVVASGVVIADPRTTATTTPTTVDTVATATADNKADTTLLTADNERTAAHTVTQIQDDNKARISSTTLGSGTGMEALQDMATRGYQSGISPHPSNIYLPEQVHTDGRGHDRRHTTHAQRRMDQGNQGLATAPRALLQTQVGQESFRQMALHPGVRGNQQIYGQEALQGRRFAHPQGTFGTRHVHGVNGHQGRVLQQGTAIAHAGPDFLQIRNQGPDRFNQGLPVQGDPSRMEFKSKSPPHNAQRGYEGGTPSWHSHGTSYGRHHHPTQIRKDLWQTAQPDGNDSGQVRLQGECRKDQATKSHASLVWGEDRNNPIRKDDSNGSKDQRDEKNGWMDYEDEQRLQSDTKNDSRLHWQDPISGFVPGLRDGAHFEPHQCSDTGFGSKRTTMGFTSTFDDGSFGGASVFPNQMQVPGSTLSNKPDRSSLSVRCFELGIWGEDFETPRRMEDTRPDDDIGFLDRRRIEDAYQRERARRKFPSGTGMFESSKRLRVQPATFGLPPERAHGQPSFENIQQQTRGQVTAPQQDHLGFSQMGEGGLLPFRVSDNINLSGRGQDDRDWRGRTLPHGSLGRGNTAQSENFPSFNQNPTIQPGNRPICNSIQSSTPTVLHGTSRQTSFGDKRNDSTMEPTSLCISPHQHDHKVFAESSVGKSYGDGGSTFDSNSNLVSSTATIGGFNSSAVSPRQADVQVSQPVPQTSQTMVKMGLDWSAFVVEHIAHYRGLEKEDAKKVAERLWAPTTVPGYKSKWKKFYHWYEKQYGEEPTSQPNFIKRTKAWMMITIEQAIDAKNKFYEELNDDLSAISGTIHHTLGVRPGEDPAVQRLRERASTILQKRKDVNDAKGKKTAIDVPNLLKLSNNDGNNEDLDTKRLRAKLSALMIIDTAARPETIQHCTPRNIYIAQEDGRKVMTLLPTSTKDQHLAKNKKTRTFKITEFPYARNICTISTYMEYRKRIAKFSIVDDIDISTIGSDGKPTKARTHSVFVTLTHPHGSLAAKTVRSECKKYLESLQEGIGPKELRKAVPSLIQFIDKVTDSQTAKDFHWQRDETFKKWYKANIPDDIKKHLANVKRDFPRSWKLRHLFIPKTRFCKEYRENNHLSVKHTIHQHFSSK